MNTDLDSDYKFWRNWFVLAIGILLLNGIALGGTIWIVVKVLQWTGVL